MAREGGVLVYGKIFSSMYDGTLRADWQALVTMQQLIVLCDAHGVVDMTPHAIHGRTGIPLDIIDHGLGVLASPDPHSRSSELEGRRIVLVDDARPWGWRIVNYLYYRNLASVDDKRSKDRDRIAAKRSSDKSQPVAGSSDTSPEIANVAHTEEEAKAEAKGNKQKKVTSLPEWLNKDLWGQYKEHRRKLKAPLTDYAEYLELEELTKLREAGNDHEKVLKRTIQKGWRGLFPLTDTRTATKKPKDFPR
jgi:hypothetical protein